MAGTTAIPRITKLTIQFGTHVPLDYDGDNKLDDVFVIMKGGLGNVGLISAVRNQTSITFTFAGAGVGGGSAPGKGDSSFFFGLTSKHNRKNLTVMAAAVPPPDLSLQAWVPTSPFAPPKP